MRRNTRGAKPSRAMKYSSRGKPLNAELAATSSTSVVATCTNPYAMPLPTLLCAIWERTVWLLLGEAPSK